MLTSLLAGLASGEALLALGRARRAATAYLAAALLALTGIGFLIGAAYMWAAARYGHLEAAVGFGILFLALAGLAVLVHRLLAGARARRAAARRSADLKAMGAAAGIAALPTLLRSPAGAGATLLVPVLGLVAYLVYREYSKRDPEDPEH